MRLVLDTNVVVSGLLWNGPERKLLMAAGGENVWCFTSAPLLAELDDVLSRSKFNAKIAASGYSVNQLIRFYAGLNDLVRPLSIPRVAPDPDDDVVLSTAAAAKADFIVTGDKPLLTVNNYNGVQLISVQSALGMLAAI